jgi:hypothetical protein
MPLGSEQFPRAAGYGLAGLAEGMKFGLEQEGRRQYMDVMKGQGQGRGTGPEALIPHLTSTQKDLSDRANLLYQKVQDIGPAPEVGTPEHEVYKAKVFECTTELEEIRGLRKALMEAAGGIYGHFGIKSPGDAMPLSKLQQMLQDAKSTKAKSRPAQQATTAPQMTTGPQKIGNLWNKLFGTR